MQVLSLAQDCAYIDRSVSSFRVSHYSESSRADGGGGGGGGGEEEKGERNKSSEGKQEIAHVQQALDTLNREMVEIKQTLKLDINCVLQALHTIMSVLPQQWKEGREGSDAGAPPQSDSRGLGGDAGQIVFRQIVFHNTTDDWSRRSSGHRIL
jgi:hypothetical protein